jgi:flagellar M-ring protein FliF
MALRLAIAPKAALAAGGAAAGIAGGDASALAGGRPAGQIEDSEEMVQMANIDGALRMSSIRRVSDLVDGRAEDSLSLLRSWLAPEAN